MEWIGEWQKATPFFFLALFVLDGQEAEPAAASFMLRVWIFL